jgi:hypothetical protein
MRFVKRVQPSNMKPEFLNDDTIEIDLPNQIIDISSLRIYYEAAVDSVEKYDNGEFAKRFMPRLSQSIIQELDIHIDNRPVQRIKEYNYLFNILNDGLNEYDDIDGNKTDTIMYSTIDNTNNATSINDLYFGDENKYNYFIDKYIGFLNDVKILDCRNKTVKVVIKLAPKWITFKGIDFDSGTVVETYNDYKYRIRNVFANIDVISPDEFVAKETDIVFEDYKYVEGLKETNKNTVLSLKHKGNINYILSSFKDYDAETDTGLQFIGANENETKFGTLDLTASQEERKIKYNTNLLNNSLYFKRNGLNIKNCQYKLNGQDITPLMSITEIYNLAKKFFGGMKRVKTIDSFQNDFFCFPIDLGQVPDDMISEIEFAVKADNNNPNGGTGIMFLSYDKSYKF